MTSDQIKQARARCEAATKGPWHVFRAGVDTGDGVFVHERSESGRADSEFAARARTDLPLALDEIERLREALEHYESCACVGGKMARRALEEEA